MLSFIQKKVIYLIFVSYLLYNNLESKQFFSQASQTMLFEA